MINFIAIHTFKSEQLRAQYLETAAQMSPKEVLAMVTGPRAVCQMNWMGVEGTNRAFCFWKADSHEAIIEQLGELNNFFDTETDEMLDEVLDFAAMR